MISRLSNNQNTKSEIFDICPVRFCSSDVTKKELSIDQIKDSVTSDRLNVVDITPDNIHRFCWHLIHKLERKFCIYAENDTEASLVNIFEINFLTDTLHLGDLIIVFGNPLATNLCGPPNTPSFSIYFQDNIIALMYSSQDKFRAKLTPYLVVKTISFYRSKIHTNDLPNWKGFVDQPDCVP